MYRNSCAVVFYYISLLYLCTLDYALSLFVISLTFVFESILTALKKENTGSIQSSSSSCDSSEEESSDGMSDTFSTASSSDDDKKKKRRKKKGKDIKFKKSKKM